MGEQEGRAMAADGALGRFFQHAHLYMGSVLLITILGFAPGYFLRLSEATWFQHLHGVSATLWMILLIVQPWLATRGKMMRHRRNGLLGLLLAGAVIGTALASVPFNIQNAIEGRTNPVVTADFLYGITFVDLILVLGFSCSLAMAVLKVKSLENHALWMLSSAFWVFVPGLTRLLGKIFQLTLGFDGRTLIDVVWWAGVVAALLIGTLMLVLRKLHPALVLALVGNLSVIFVRTVGENEMWRAFCQSVFA